MDHHYLGDESIILRDADVIGQGTSFEEGKPRWSEATVYLTSGDNYFVTVVGRSDVPGETDRHWALFNGDAGQLVKDLTRQWRTQRGLAPYIYRALSDAAASDDDINDALSAYERWGR